MIYIEVTLKNIASRSNRVCVHRQFKSHTFEFSITYDKSIVNLEHLDGHNFSFKVEREFSIALVNETLIITKAIDGRTPIFICKKQNKISISNDLFSLLDNDNRSVNNNYLAYYLFHEDAQTRDTPFNTIFKLINGETYQVNDNGVESFSTEQAEAIFFNRTNIDYVSSIECEITRTIKPDAPIYIDFSGGFDSTSLLLSGASQLPSLKAVTFFDSSSCAHDDIDIARQICKQYKVQHACIDMCEKSSLILDDQIYSHHPSLLFIGLGYEKELLAETEITEATFLNGHGGDHLFYSNPGVDVIAEALISSDFEVAHSCLKKLAKYYGASYSNLMFKTAQTIRRYLCRQNIIYKSIDNNRQYFSNAWVSSDFIALADKVVDYKKIFDIPKFLPTVQTKLSHFYQLAQDVSHLRLRDELGRMAFPFFNTNTIAMAFSTDPAESFDGAINRKQIRQSFYDRHKLSHIWRKSKGHTTSVAIRSLNMHQTTIKEMLRQGYLVSTGLVTWQALEKELSKACYGVMGLSPLLMHTIGIEIFLNKVGVH